MTFVTIAILSFLAVALSSCGCGIIIASRFPIVRRDPRFFLFLIGAACLLDVIAFML